MLTGSEGEFRPDDGLTLAELATVITRVIPLTERAENTFTDVEVGSWYEDAILKCVAAGIIGSDVQELYPREPLSRADAFVMLSRAFGIEPEPELSGLNGYNDAKRIPDEAKPYFARLLELGIIEGTSPVQLDPMENITRAEAVAVLDRLDELGYITAEGV